MKGVGKFKESKRTLNTIKYEIPQRNNYDDVAALELLLSRSDFYFCFTKLKNK